MSTRSFLLGSRTWMWFRKSEMKNFSAVGQNLKDILVPYRGALTEKNVDNWKPSWTFSLLLFYNRIHRIYWGRGGTAHAKKELRKENALAYNLGLFFTIHWCGLAYIHIFGGIIWGDVSGKHFCFWQGAYLSIQCNKEEKKEAKSAWGLVEQTSNSFTSVTWIQKGQK